MTVSVIVEDINF